MTEKRTADYYGGRPVTQFVLCGDGMEIGISDFGAKVDYIRTETNFGWKDITLGFRSTEDYARCGIYCGALVGRVANRIAGGRFSLGGKEYVLDRNNGGNCNHGGFDGYDRRFFSGSVLDDGSVQMELFSPDGDQGFPGNLKLKAVFSLEKNVFTVNYEAVSDADTLWVPTCHIYFNLGGEDGGTALDSRLRLNSSAYTPLSPAYVPSGETVPVSGTPFDFSSGATLFENMDFSDGQIAMARGYDHNFILDGEHAASVRNDRTGIGFDLYTDMPALQLYSAGFLDGEEGKTRKYGPGDGFCLEPQFVPDAVNLKGFEIPEIKAGEVKKHFIRYEFSRNG